MPVPAGCPVLLTSKQEEEEEKEEQTLEGFVVESGFLQSFEKEERTRDKQVQPREREREWMYSNFALAQEWRGDFPARFLFFSSNKFRFNWRIGLLTLRSALLYKVLIQI